jgi:acetylglutamate kinase
MLTDVAGVYRDWPDSDEVIGELTVDELEKLMPEVAAGMVPKLEACRRAVRSGVSRSSVIDGRVPHALLLELFTDDGIGTMVVDA